MNSIKAPLKWILGGVIDTWARLMRFSFPKKYPWSWKLEMLRNHYEKDTTDLFGRIITPGMTVLDVGGHIGYFTRLFSRAVGPQGRVIAFEPDPSNFALLKKNTAHLSNVTAINAAMTEHKGPIDFYHIVDSTGCHTTIPSDAPAEKFTVEGIPIDSLSPDINPDIIKIDIEGGEPHALLGMTALLTSPRPLRIVMELNPEALARGGTNPADVIASLREKGFEAYGILKDGMKSAPIHDITSLKLYEGKSDYVNVLFERN